MQVLVRCSGTATFAEAGTTSWSFRMGKAFKRQTWDDASCRCMALATMVLRVLEVRGRRPDYKPASGRLNRTVLRFFATGTGTASFSSSPQAASPHCTSTTTSAAGSISAFSCALATPSGAEASASQATAIAGRGALPGGAPGVPGRPRKSQYAPPPSLLLPPPLDAGLPAIGAEGSSSEVFRRPAHQVISPMCA